MVNFFVLLKRSIRSEIEIKSPQKLIFCLCFLFVSLTSTSIAFGAVWYVNGDIPQSGSGTSWDSPFKEIKLAVGAADNNDEIWITTGQYNINSTIMVDKAVKFFGGFTGVESLREQRDWLHNATILDANYTCQVFLFSGFLSGIENDGIVIDGITVREGNATAYPNHGAGIHLNLMGASATIKNCHFIGNRADGTAGGAAIYVYMPARIENCIFTDNLNTGNGVGGALYIKGNTSIASCSFSGNEAETGGAIFESSYSMTISDCLFDGNRARNFGGAILAKGYFSITNSQFLNNLATQTLSKGGAIYVDYTVPGNSIIDKSVFHNNTSPGSGSAVNVHAAIKISNCLLWGNGNNEVLYATANTTIVNSTFWGNSLTFAGTGTKTISPVITNTLIVGEGVQIIFYYSTPDISYSFVPGGYSGEGNLNDIPLFVNPENGDFHLLKGSPGIDQGTASGAPQYDLAGTPRPKYQGYDIGAFEYFLFVHAGDADNDGIICLIDAIIALQAINQFEPDRIMYVEADVNNDAKIGMEEAIAVLQIIAGLRNNFAVVTEKN